MSFCVAPTHVRYVSYVNLRDTISITSQLIRCLPMVGKKTDSWLLQLSVLLAAIGSLNPAAGFKSSDWACGILNIRFMVSVSVRLCNCTSTTQNCYAYLTIARTEKWHSYRLFEVIILIEYLKWIKIKKYTKTLRKVMTGSFFFLCHNRT
jgi:hypothetical protein